MNYLMTLLFQLSLNYLRKSDQDVRLVYDNPQGSLTFQGNIKYARKFAIPKRDFQK